MSVKRIFSNLKQDKLGILIGIFLTFILYTFTISLTPPYIITGSPKGQLVATAGETFTLCRHVKYIRDTEVTISRALTREVDDGLVETINFDNFTVPRTKGENQICRNIRIPRDVPTGVWTFHTYLKVYTTPWWYSTFEGDPVNLRVIGRE